MIGSLNSAVDAVEAGLVADPAASVEVAALARRLGTTEHHLRRMFSSLAGMPLSEYVRRRRMSLAAADLVTGDDDLLAIAVRYGYGSTEAFGRAFRAVHGVGPGDVRRDGGPLRTQPRIRFHLTVHGGSTDGHPHHRPARAAARRPRRARAAGARGRQPGDRRARRVDPARGDAAAQGAERHRAGGRARRQRRPRPRPRGGQRADLPARRRDHGRARGARRARHHRGARGHVGRLPHRGPAPRGAAGGVGGDGDRVVPLAAVAAAARPEIVAMSAYDAAAATATCELWLPVEPVDA